MIVGLKNFIRRIEPNRMEYVLNQKTDMDSLINNALIINTDPYFQGTKMAMPLRYVLSFSISLLGVSLVLSTINLVIVLILNYFYYHVAVRSAEKKLYRTQDEYEYDESLSLEIYLLQFVNYY